jgi:hypothetical protein
VQLALVREKVHSQQIEINQMHEVILAYVFARTWASSTLLTFKIVEIIEKRRRRGKAMVMEQA